MNERWKGRKKMIEKIGLCGAGERQMGQLKIIKFKAIFTNFSSLLLLSKKKKLYLIKDFPETDPQSMKNKNKLKKIISTF